MQARYQYGNLTLRKRKKGPDVWQFRWMENGMSKSVLIGTVERYPNRSDAERAVEHLRIKINNQNPQSQLHAVTVGGLIDRFVQQELPNGRRFQTQSEYRTYFNRYIRPQWVVSQFEKSLAVKLRPETLPRNRETCFWRKLTQCRYRTGSKPCRLHQRRRAISEMPCICFFNGRADGG